MHNNQNWMHRFRSIRWTALLVLLGTGCYARPSAEEQSVSSPPVLEQPVATTVTPKEKVVEETELKVDDLRPALLRTTDIYPKGFSELDRDVINESPTVALPDGGIKIGLWRCNLKEKTFIYGDEAAPGTASYRVKKGIFARNAKGEWVGEITEVISAHK